MVTLRVTRISSWATNAGTRGSQGSHKGNTMGVTIRSQENHTGGHKRITMWITRGSQWGHKKVTRGTHTCFCMEIEHFSEQPSQVETWRVHQNYNPGQGPNGASLLSHSLSQKRRSLLGANNRTMVTNISHRWATPLRTARYYGCVN